jgi:PAS domain S-box-containing protein
MASASHNFLKAATQINHLFLGQVDFQKSMLDILACLGDSLGIDHCSIFSLDKNPEKLPATAQYRWQRPDSKKKKPSKSLTILPFQDFPQALEPLLKEQAFHTTISSVPSGALRNFMEQKAIASLLFYPLSSKSKPWGFLAIFVNREPRKWTLDEIAFVEHVVSQIKLAFSRDRIYQESRIAQQKLELASETTEEGLWEWDIPQNIVVFSRYWLELLGLEKDPPPENIEAWQALIHPEDLPETMDKIERHLSGHSKTFESVHRCRTKSGRYLWILDRGRVTERDADGSPQRFIGTHTNISRLKETENSLRSQKIFINTLLDSMEDLVFYISQDHTYQDCNDQYANYLGLPKEEILGKTVYELFPPPIGENI